MTGKRNRYLKTHLHATDCEKFDSDVLFKIKKYLRKEYHIPFEQIKIECTIRISYRRGVLLGRLTYEKISQLKGLLHTPDITITNADDKPHIVIEQDGKNHETKTQLKKDLARNRHYEYAGILCIVLNTKKIKTEKKTPGAYLDDAMRDIGITK